MEQLAAFDQVAAADIAYIRRHWAMLAGEAWRGYVRQGRGIILIDRTRGQASRVSYRTRITPRNVVGSGWLSAEIAAQIQ